MQHVIDDFNVRTNEIDIYIEFVKKLHERDCKLYMPHKIREQDKYSDISGDLTAICKANVFIILYNIIESSVREGILDIYESIKVGDYNYSDVRLEVRKLWTKFQFKNAYSMESSWDSYYRKLEDIINQIVSSSILELDRNAIPVSGNLNADKVRSVCDLHGISTTVHHQARGGISLEEIKSQRNLLAHGHLSFVECGRQFEIAQIESFKKEAIIFVRGILTNMKAYSDAQRYLAANA
ncbi:MULTISPECIES: MAE_28990/MAE_18760 family HEPN-like nuclease [Vibrio harveyi group]|nr:MULTISPECIES: MAE_28990/MAE_18760 family HEPN-like nuclease [Vibrio harveyi group]